MRYTILLLSSWLLICTAGCQILTLPFRLIGEVIKAIPFVSMQIEPDVQEDMAVATRQEQQMVATFQARLQTCLAQPRMLTPTSPALPVKRADTILLIDLRQIKDQHLLVELYRRLSRHAHIRYMFGYAAALPGGALAQQGFLQKVLAAHQGNIYGNGIFARIAHPLNTATCLAALSQGEDQIAARR